MTTIIFVCAIQALLLCGLLAFKKPFDQQRFFLALLLFFFALMALNIGLVTVLHNNGQLELFRYFQLELLYGIGPSLYFYTKSITNKDWHFSKRELLHFIPVILEFLFYRTAFYRLGADGLYTPDGHPYTVIYLTQQWVGIISISFYALLSIGLLLRLKPVEFKEKRWTLIPAVLYSFFWIAWNILSEIDRFYFDRALKEFYFLPAFVGLAIITCVIGFVGYVKFGRDQDIPNSKKQKSEPAAVNTTLKNKILRHMEESQAYLDPNLNLNKLATALESNEKEVSTTINSGFGKNYYDFINTYRIDTFKEKVKKLHQENKTLLAYAYESGFNSKSTFNHAFKKITGTTPSQYIKSLENRSE